MLPLARKVVSASALVAYILLSCRAFALASVYSVPSIAALQALGATAPSYPHVSVSAYYSGGTEGGGQFDYYATCPGTVDGGIYVSVTVPSDPSPCYVRAGWKSGPIHAVWWGPTTTDSSAAINSAISFSCDVSNGALDVIYESASTITGPITDTCAAHTWVQLRLGPINKNFLGGYGVIIGQLSSQQEVPGNPSGTTNITISSIRPPGTPWDASAACIDLRNLSQANHMALQASQCGDGVLQEASWASYYNNFLVGTFVNNQNCWHLRTNGPSGSVNQNTYIGGGCHTSSETDFNGIVKGIVLEENAGNPIDGNNWYSTDFEMSNKNPIGSVVDFYCQGSGAAPAIRNRAFGIRHEDGLGPMLQSQNVPVLGGRGCTENRFEIDYGYPAPGSAANLLLPGTPDALFLLQQNVITGNSSSAIGQNQPVPVLSIRAGNFVEFSNASMLQPSGDALIRENGSGFNAIDPGCGAAITLDPAAPNVLVANGSLCQIVKFVDVTGANRDWQRVLRVQVTHAQAGGRILAELQDSSGADLVSTSDSGGNFFYAPSFHAWITGSDMPVGQSTYYLGLGPNVASVALGFTAGTQSARVKRIEVFADTESGLAQTTDKDFIAKMNGHTAVAITPDPGPRSQTKPDDVPALYSTGLCVARTLPAAGATQPWCFDGAHWQ